MAGLWLMGAGVAVFITELVRDPEGRGSLLGGALDGPQAAAVLLVLAGALVLLERKAPGKPVEKPAVTNPEAAHQGTKNEAEHG